MCIRDSRKNTQTGCQTTLHVAAPPGLGWDPDQDVALQRLRLWAVSAREYQAQASHILSTPLAEGLPPASVLAARRVDARPEAPPPTDAE
eukprot:7903978-Alexandrium_andersonii.AAC.1